ncbi:NXPE family member 3-like isoform X1 [Colossoma macropomum]|uniref:NXPE family member 3-like isoform X1 n=2 Tax=Colossoma macropomum TaxID=42526 RepID=UPI0018650E35|nr:NXPE family member 3-like isoform X1 [Colossoma macropomum]XP_036445131.1 NXPE family member 3-like isoform X1 [Colossoma macropomum]
MYWKAWKKLIKLVIILTFVSLAIFWWFGQQLPVSFLVSIAHKPERRPVPLMDRKLANLCSSRPASQSDSAHISPTDSTFISPEELQLIEKALKWPAPPTSVTAVDQATNAYTSSYILQNPRKSYSVGDNITVVITARDGLNNSKAYGGDFFQAKLFNAKLKASVYGEVVDHHNGTYTATFKLLWEGHANVSIRLIHSSEAVEVLLRHRERDPDKVFFTGVFRRLDRQEKVVCNAQRSERLLKASQCCCEYKNPITGESWICRKPSRLPCSAWVDHGMGGYQARLSKLESTLLHSKYTNKNLPGEDITVNVSRRDLDSGMNVKCVPGLDTPSPAGFYLHDNWTSLMCHTQSFRTANQTVACLKDKQVLMMGDSTLRQWYEYLLKTVPTLKQLNLYTSAKSGPFEAVDTGNNIRLVWRAHGLPIRTSLTPRADLHYIASEVAALAGGQHSVVVFTIWAHFTTFPLATYLKRLAGIRRAVQALLQRAPQTLVLIKSANTGYKDIYGSDWLSWQLDWALRMMFRELPVVIIDVWQMTSCHYSPDDIHPSQEVIKNEVDLLLSFVCPR